MDCPTPTRKCRTLTPAKTETFNDDLLYLLDELRALGIDRVVAVDLTRPEIGVPVVRVVVPGLEGLITDPNYLPGRRACRGL